MFIVKILTLLVLIFIPQVQNSNILFVVLSPSISHQIVFQAVWKELSLKGHNVHVITPNPLNDTTLTNLTEIDISQLYDDLKNLVPEDTMKYLIQKPDFLTVFIKDSIMTKFINKVMDIIFNYKNVQLFLKEKHYFDVTIIEWLFPTTAAFGAKYNCPIIGISSLGLPIPALDTVGNPAHPISAPDHNLPIGRNLNFKDRIMSTLWAIYVRIYYHYAVLPREDALIKKYLGKNLPYLGDIERNVSLILVNRNPIFHRIYPTVPTIIEIGGIQLKRPQKELKSELQEFLNKYNNGVIYLSFGSNVQSILLPEEIRNIFLQTFIHLPYGIVWKWERGELPGKTSNIYTDPWLPQIELLSHKNVKLFITQGGLQSLQDTISNHVPIIGFPCHSDQTTNVDTLVHYGAGIGLELNELTVEKLNYSIYQIINNISYYNNIKNLDKLMKDQPVNGLSKAIWWIEYVIRNRGAKHLRSPTLDIPWYQYLMLDIILFLLSIISITILILYIFIRIIIKIFRKKLRTNDSLKKFE